MTAFTETTIWQRILFVIAIFPAAPEVFIRCRKDFFIVCSRKILFFLKALKSKYSTAVSIQQEAKAT